MKRPCSSWYRVALFVIGLAAISWSESDAESEVSVPAKPSANQPASAVGVYGGLCVQIGSITDGKLLATRVLAEPVWDGMAVANGRLFVSTRDGQVVSLSKE